MLCDKYQQLSHIDKVKYIGSLIHAVQSSNNLFSLGEKLIQVAEDIGLFTGVTILPDPLFQYPDNISEFRRTDIDWANKVKLKITPTGYDHYKHCLTEDELIECMYMDYLRDQNKNEQIL